ncbi:MAG: Cupin protein [Chloroflexi bacterium]|nr:Cupin protein [Chloroflexota bacterium]
MAVQGTGNIDQHGEFVLADRTEDELAAFEHELDHASMMGEWQVPRKPEPDPEGVPHLWKWGTVYDKMLKASDDSGAGAGLRAGQDHPARGRAARGDGHLLRWTARCLRQSPRQCRHPEGGAYRGHEPGLERPRVGH